MANKGNQINIKDVIDNSKAVIILDTNVFLNIYRYSPEFTEFALDCIKTVMNHIVIPSVVDLEYKKHRKESFFAMKKRVQKASGNIKSQIQSSKTKIIKSCDVLKKNRYPDIDQLEISVIEKLEELQQNVDNFFLDRSVLDQLADSWEGKDYVLDLFDEISQNRMILPFSQEELYRICNEGESRYENQIPPGFKDAKNKDGIRKYSDLIIWKEVIGYAKNRKCDVIFVTDDVKTDWWKDENTFHESLVTEFETETGKEIYPFTSGSFYTKVSEAYGIGCNDAIEIALRNTDDKYFERVESEVLDDILDDIAWSGESLIDTSTAHIGTEGIDEIEVDSSNFVEAIQVDRYDTEIMYHFKYFISAHAISHDYWGRDDDTREVILSPGIKHKFEGNIIVQVIREIDTYIDYNEDGDFETAQIIKGELEEVEYEELLDDDIVEGGYTTCPQCGKPINYENDAGTSFCIQCEMKRM